MARQSAKAKRLAGLAADYAAQLEQGRAAYTAADELLDQLLAAGAAPGDVYPLPDGKHAKLIDAFAAANKSFKPCAFARYSLKIYSA